MVFSSTVLPEPLPPMMVVIPPSSMVRLVPLSTAWWSKFL